MLTQINGLHHVTAIASHAATNNAFFTDTLGLRRVKKTVNFDAPDVYHLYYGDEKGAAGSVMTYFPFHNARRGEAGTGEVSITSFAVPEGALPFWKNRFAERQVPILDSATRFGEQRLTFLGPDGDRLSLVEQVDERTPWAVQDIPGDVAIRGFHSAELKVAESDARASAELLGFMGYELTECFQETQRFQIPNGNGADRIDLTVSSATKAIQGAGSVHHIAFSVDAAAHQMEVRKALLDAGYQVTAVKDRSYFQAIYFRSPGGILFEIATNEPGFDCDEDIAHLGEALKLPEQHEHLRPELARSLPNLTS